MITTLLIIIACIVSFNAGHKTGFNKCDHKYKEVISEQMERVRKEMKSSSQTGQFFEK